MKLWKNLKIWGLGLKIKFFFKICQNFGNLIFIQNLPKFLKNQQNFFYITIINFQMKKNPQTHLLWPSTLIGGEVLHHSVLPGCIYFMFFIFKCFSNLHFVNFRHFLNFLFFKIGVQIIGGG